MFSTFEHDKIDFPPIFNNEDLYSTWRNVRVRLFAPYFHVTMRDTDTDDDGGNFTVLLSNIYQLQLADVQLDAKIINVQLVSPGWLNGTNEWQMNPLERIFSGKERYGADHEQFAFVYLLSDGTRFLDARIVENENDLTEIESVFIAPR